MPADPRLMALPALRRAAEEEAQGMADGLGLSVTQRAMLLERVMARACDPTRPASRDAVARLVAERLGWPSYATSPSLYWTTEQDGPRDRDGAPEGDDWPAGWWLQGDDGHMHFFTSADWCPMFDGFTTIAGLPDGRGNAAEALALIALAVLVPVTPEPPNAGERP